jgi:hypothetical protein
VVCSRVSECGVIDEIAANVSFAHAERIERELAKRHRNVVAVPDPFGGQYVVYRVPGWRESPLRRLKITFYRWRRRAYVA